MTLRHTLTAMLIAAALAGCGGWEDTPASVGRALARAVNTSFPINE